MDSISISPQECYTLDILYGAGSLTGMIGDAIFHCHLYPHFHEGMWTLWRVFDRLEDGTGEYPTPIERLIPLKDRPLPPEKDLLHPGYPNFINGEFGEYPLQPPLGMEQKYANLKLLLSRRISSITVTATMTRRVCFLYPWTMPRTSDAEEKRQYL